MTLNSQILGRPKGLLTSLEQQQAFILRMALQPLPCPACGTRCTQVEASGLGLDEYDVKLAEQAHRYHCTVCHRELVHDVYVVGGHGWSLHPAEQAKLRPLPATPKDADESQGAAAADR